MDESERISPKSKIKQQNILATRQCENKRAKSRREWRSVSLVYGQQPDRLRLSVMAVAFFPVDQARGRSEHKKKKHNRTETIKKAKSAKKGREWRVWCGLEAGWKSDICAVVFFFMDMRVFLIKCKIMKFFARTRGKWIWSLAGTSWH